MRKLTALIVVVGLRLGSLIAVTIGGAGVGAFGSCCCCCFFAVVRFFVEDGMVTVNVAVKK